MLKKVWELVIMFTLFLLLLLLLKKSLNSQVLLNTMSSLLSSSFLLSTSFYSRGRRKYDLASPYYVTGTVLDILPICLI